MGKTKLPNYKGMFLRGNGSQTYRQKNGSSYSTTTHKSGNIGVVQGDAIRNITGDFGKNTSFNGYLHTFNGYSDQQRDEGFNGAFKAYPLNRVDIDDGGDYGTNASIYVKFNASNVVPTATENRPVNVAVNYLIKAY